MHTLSFVGAFVGSCQRAGQFEQRLKSLPVVGNQVLKSWPPSLWKRLGAQDPQYCISRRVWLLCQCWHPHSALAVPWLAPPWSPPGEAVWGDRGVTAAIHCPSTPSADEAHCCPIINLSHRTSRIFNLAVSYSLSWVQTTLFCMGTCINIAILPTSG